MTFVSTKSQKLIYCLSLVSHSPYVISTKYFVSIESQHVCIYSVHTNKQRTQDNQYIQWQSQHFEAYPSGTSTRESR